MFFTYSYIDKITGSEVRGGMRAKTERQVVLAFRVVARGGIVTILNAR